MPEPKACGSSSVGGKTALWRGLWGARTVCRGCGRSLSQSSGKSEGVSKVGLRLAGAGGLCRSRVRLGTHETSLPSASPASIVPHACKYGTTGLMGGSQGGSVVPTGCGALPWAGICPGLIPQPQHGGSLQRSLSCAEGSITHQISWGAGELSQHLVISPQARKQRSAPGSLSPGPRLSFPMWEARAGPRGLSCEVTAELQGT